MRCLWKDLTLSRPHIWGVAPSMHATRFAGQDTIFLVPSNACVSIAVNRSGDVADVMRQMWGCMSYTDILGV